MLNKMQKVLSNLKDGKFVIVVDDPDRENEGDFIMAAEFINPEKINFLLEYGRGLICTPLTASHANKLNLSRMITNNTSKFTTAFTVSIDAALGGSGISASDRSLTIKLLADELSTEASFERPGHIFPLIAVDGGLSERDGHTEASIELMKLAKLKPVSVICEILNKEGEVADSKLLREISRQFDIPIISIAEIKSYLSSVGKIKLSVPEVTSVLPTEFGDFNFSLFKVNGQEIKVLHKAGWNQYPTVRIHSECNTGDVFSSLRCDCGPQLKFSMEYISKNGGVLIYMPQEGRGIGLIEKLKAYNLQDEGFDTAEANIKLGHAVDGREYSTISGILSYYKITECDLITNNPDKINSMNAMGFIIRSVINTMPKITEHNLNYITTKINRFNHHINLGSKQ